MQLEQWGGLVVDTSALRFEGTAVGNQYDRPLRMHNHRSAALQVRFACPTSHEFTLEVFPPVATVPPHRRAQFAVSFTPYATFTLSLTIDVLATTVTAAKTTTTTTTTSNNSEEDENNEEDDDNEEDQEEQGRTYRQTVTLSADVAPCTLVPFRALALEHPAEPAALGPAAAAHWGAQRVRLTKYSGGRYRLLAEFVADVARLVRLPACAQLERVLGGCATPAALFVVAEDRRLAPLDAVRARARHRRGPGRVPPALVLRAALDIARGLAALHAHGVAHGHLRPAAVVFASEDAATPAPAVCRLRDYGTTACSDADAADRAAPLYAAPEVLARAAACSTVDLGPAPARGRAATAPASDIYSLAVLVAELWNTLPPYSELSIDNPWGLLLAIPSVLFSPLVPCARVAFHACLCLCHRRCDGRAAGRHTPGTRTRLPAAPRSVPRRVLAHTPRRAARRRRGRRVLWRHARGDRAHLMRDARTWLYLCVYLMCVCVCVCVVSPKRWGGRRSGEKKGWM